MLGTIRFLLAGAVVAFHLLGMPGQLGPLAVVCFYVISGFLITLVLNETYRFNFGAFALNRVLRLYPAYLVVALIALILHSTTQDSSAFHAAWKQSTRLSDIAGNLFVVPWAFLGDGLVTVNFLKLSALSSPEFHYRLVPSTWSVAVEIVCYFLLWLAVARSMAMSLATIVIGVIWQIAVIVGSHNPDLAYYPIPAAILPFALGSLAYRVSVLLKTDSVHDNRRQLGLLAVFMAAFVANWFVNTAALIVAQLVMAAFLVALGKAKPVGNAAWVDRWLGDLAYPIFLGHYVFAYAAWVWLGGAMPVRGLTVFVLGSSLTILASILIVLTVDQNVSRLRDKVRGHRRSGGAESGHAIHA